MELTAETAARDDLSAEQVLEMIERLQKEGLGRAAASEPAPTLPTEPPPQAQQPQQALRTPLEARLEHDLAALVMDVLKLEPHEFSPTHSLMDYGMDSISSTEIGNRFTARFDIVIPPTVFFEFQDLRGLGRYLVNNHGEAVRRVIGDELAQAVETAPPPMPAAAPAAPSRPAAAAEPVARSEAPPPAARRESATSATATPTDPVSIETLWGAVDEPATSAPPRGEPPRRPPSPPAAAAARRAPDTGTPTTAVPEPSREHLAAQQAYVDLARTVKVQGAGGRCIEAAVYGRGKPVLLLGGLAMHYSVMWRLQLRELGECHRLIMYHMPGCGSTDFYEPLSLQSLSSDVAELLDALGIDGPVPVVGYSFGGVLAQRFCLDHPERCRSLVVTVSSPFAEGADDFATLMRELRKSDRFMEINRGWNIPSLPAYQAVVAGFDHRSALGGLQCPALVISGGDDRYMLADYGRALADALPQARYECFPRAGHLLGFTHHAEYNRLLLDFLGASDATSPLPAPPAALPAFVPTEATALEVLHDYVHRGDQGHCAILSPQSAQVGLLLNRIYERNKEGEEAYRCLYLTSQHEALDAALRLARHRARNRNAESTGEILVVEPGEAWQRYFDPLGLGAEDALVPGVRFVATLGEARQALAAGTRRLTALVLACDHATSLAAIEELLGACAAHGVVSVLVEPNDPRGGMRDWIGPDCGRRADIYVLGESLSGSQLPIGACMVRAEVHQTWTMTPNESYVRNVMTNFGYPLSAAREALLGAFGEVVGADTHKALRRIEADVTACYEAHLRYGNAGYAKVARLHGFDARFGNARGMRSGLRDDAGKLRSIVDCFVNVGTSPRGLNPLDVIDGVARQHDTAVDYWAQLAALLCERTGVDHAFPASSNVTAVEVAVTLAALAQPHKRKMLFFSGGLGFSMLSAVASHDRVFDIFRKPFEPLYRHSVFVDAHAADAAAQLEAHLLSGEIGLVWFETIQVDANATRPVPPALIELIVRHREAGGYLVGVDETQTNLVTGPLLHSAASVPAPDLIALGTALCDSLVPFGVVLCSNEVRRRAEKASAARVEELSQRQRCQLASHIALHSLQRIWANKLDEQARATGTYFKERLQALRGEIPLISDVRGEGLLLTIDLDLSGTDPFLQRSFGYLLWGAMLRDPQQGVAIAVCPIHNNSLRFLPPLNITREEVDLIVDCLRRQLADGIGPVVRDCSEHCERIGDTRTALFLKSLIPQHRKEPKRMDATEHTQENRAAMDFTPEFIDRIPGGPRMLDGLRRKRVSPGQLPRVCVIGAGAGGISIAKALNEYGISFDCYDGRDRIGGIWAFDPDRKHTSVWRSMNQNTPRGLYQYSDFPMPDDYPDFPSHQQVLAYLESYVDHFGFRDRIHLNTVVDKAERLHDGSWRITLDNGTVRTYDALIVANGHHNEPNYPEYYYRDKFDGDAIHSRYYRHREDYRDKKVLVVGVGNSGSQVAVDISHSAQSTYVSLRRGVYVLPHYLFGIRMDKAMGFLNDWWFKKLLPYPLFNLVHTGLYRLLIAKDKQMGMPKPDHLMMASLPTLSESFANRIGDGKLKIVPEVKCIKGKRVHFVDGSSLEVDSIVYSTGFKTTFPFFEKDFLHLEDNRAPMYKRIFVPGVENLAFIGLFQAVTWGFLDMMEEQSKLVADYFAGFYKLPSVEQQHKDIEREQRVIRREFLATLRNNYEMHGPTYMHELAVEHRRGRVRARKAGVALPCTAAGWTSAPAAELPAELETAVQSA